MGEFEFMGRKIRVEGQGAPDSPFIITGTGYNPPLAAQIEQHIVSLCLDQTPWHLVESRVETGEGDRDLAVLKIKFFSEDDEVLQTEIWFDVTEAFGSGGRNPDHQ